MTSFFDEKFPVTVAVRVTFEDGLTFEDEIKGLNAGHAAWRARDNWSGAKIEILEVTK